MINTRITPLQCLALTLLLLFLLVAAASQLATTIPRMSVPLRFDEQHIELADNTSEAGEGTAVLVIREPGAQSGINLLAEDLIEEPDFFPSYSRYNTFMARQQRLHELLAGNDSVELVLENNSIVVAQVTYARWHALPWLFWLQLLTSGICLLTGVAVWSFRRSDPAAMYYMLIGICFVLVIFPAAVYSTRDLAMDAQLFRILSVTDHLGLYLGIACILIFLWNYPRSLRPDFPFASIVFGFSMLWWGLDTLQWLPGLNVSTRVYAITALGFGVLILLRQRRSNLDNPRNRVIIKWFLQSIIVGCAAFCFLVFLPPLLGFFPLLSQGVAFVVFLSIYISLAIGVAQYRLFDLDIWWFEIWIWLSAGIVLIGIDLALAMLLQQSALEISWMALALTGWLYFPVRQWVLGMVVVSPHRKLEHYLPDIVSEIASVQQLDELPVHWQRCLQRVFQPGKLGLSPPRQDSEPAFDGLKLICDLGLPPVRAQLEFAAHGKRLFSRSDQELASAITALFNQAALSLQARTSAVNEERERIREDIHDSLGGHILAIMHQSSEPLSQEFAKSAWWELRDILSALDYRKEPLSLVLARWKHDLSAQIQVKGVEVNWSIALGELTNVEISGFRRLNLGQSLRELITNSLRHSQPGMLEISCMANDSGLCIMIRHDGCTSEPASWEAGRGLSHIRKRIARLDGSISWNLLPANILEVRLDLPT